MARKKTTQRADKKRGSTNGASLGFEATLWAAADKLRGHMDAAVYKHVVLGPAASAVQFGYGDSAAHRNARSVDR